MTTGTDPVEWAIAKVDQLRTIDTSNASAGRIPQNKQLAFGDLTAVLEFLRRYAGPLSAFAQSAQALVDKGSGWATFNAHQMASILEGWVEYKQAGMANDPPFEVRARIEAASDLMDQVALLLADKQVHPAAPIVLTGAALEERLRGLIEDSGSAVTGRPGIDSYGAALKRDGVIDGQEAKHVTAWAGLRNQAAHGEDLDKLTVEEARIMAMAVNLFLQKHAL